MVSKMFLAIPDILLCISIVFYSRKCSLNLIFNMLSYAAITI